ncbi:MAG: inositol 2-dehydrogenase [Inquilinus sp.]|nr:inositol 2-dehydrogenase [Inquilinus sp.]
MLGFALFGAGRIGRMHADNLAASADAKLVSVYDVHGPSADAVAGKHGATVAPSVAAALDDGAVDAVLIASSTDTHVDLITAAAKAGKAILCEKPIDLDSSRVARCWQDIRGLGVPIQIGFNRRYDPSHRAVAEAVRAGEIGTVEQVIITSRDPGPPPADYLKVSGGLFRDMMIHDFDLARFVLGEEPVEVFATGDALFDENARALGDVDTAMVVMRAASGALCHINCSRRAVFGYDQRLEAFGSRGMVRSRNRRPTTVERYTETATGTRDPLLNFFIERYQEAYVAEIADFIARVEKGEPLAVTFEDGQKALLLADAANESRASGRAVKVAG